MEFDNRTSIEQGKQTLGEHKRNLMHIRTQEKAAVTPQKSEADLSFLDTCSFLDPAGRKLSFCEQFYGENHMLQQETETLSPRACNELNLGNNCV